MTFPERLKKYMSDIPCTASELSAVSGLAPSMISRYLRGEQEPGEKALKKLSSGLDFLSRDKGGPSLDNIKVCQEFQEALSGLTVKYSVFVENLSKLLSTLNVNNKDLALSLNFDPSYISRILSGSRRPANLSQFLDNISEYIASRFFGTSYVSVILNFSEHNEAEPGSKEILAEIIRQYLGSHSETSLNLMLSFLREISDFDPDAYEQDPCMDRCFSGSMTMFRRPDQKNYHGIPGLTEAFREFFTCSVNSGKKDDILFYSDFPIMDSPHYKEYSSIRTAGMAKLGQSGRKIRIVADVHRSLEELIYELKDLVPAMICGTGSIYYLKESTGRPFLHLECSSGNAVISGESFSGREKDIRCTFYRNVRETDYPAQRAKAVYDISKPMILSSGRGSETIINYIRNAVREKDVFNVFPGSGGNMRDLPSLFSDMTNRIRIHSGNRPLFNNIDLVVCPSRFALISMRRKPYCDFLIIYPRMISALEKLL